MPLFDLLDPHELIDVGQTSGPDAWLLAGILAAVLIICLVLFMLIKRRKKS